MTIVLLHPAALDRHCWQWSELEGVMVEYPGHGERPMSESEEFSLVRLADEVVVGNAGLLDLVGVSVGGGLAQTVAIRHPARVRSMVLACCGVGGSGRGSGRAAEVLRLGMAGVLTSTLERWFSPEALRRDDLPGVEYARERLLGDDPRGAAGAFGSERALPEAIATIKVPVTVLAGRHDSAVPIARSTELFGLLDNARLEVIEGTHMMLLERPKEFAAAIRRHFEWAGESALL